MAIDTGDGQLRLLIDRDADAGGNRVLDRMRIPQREDDRVFPLLRAIADADDLQILREAFRHTPNRVRNESARQAVKCPLGTAVTGTNGDELFVFLFPLDARRNQIRDCSFWPCDDDGVGLDVDLHFVRDRNGFFTNS